MVWEQTQDGGYGEPWVTTNYCKTLNKHLDDQGLLISSQMLRRSGRYKKHRPYPAAPLLEDSPAVLEDKWRAWVEVESFKR